jgi:hypothetical protein
MPPLSDGKVRALLSLVHNASSATEKGRSLEDLLCYIFGKVPGIAITHRDQLNTFYSEEIDIALWNDRIPGSLDFLPNIILIEAKNWSVPVGSSEVAWFDRKLQNRGLDFGVFVAVNGITGNASERTAAHEIIASCLRDHRRIVVMTGDDLFALRKTDTLVTLIKMKLCELAVTGTLLP